METPDENASKHQKYVHIRATRICTYMKVYACIFEEYRPNPLENTCIYVHIRHVRIRMYIIINTCIYMRIRAYCVPSKVSASAQICWEYGHILLHSSQYTASMKSDTCIYMHLRAHTFTACMHTCMYVCIQCVPYVARICTCY